jgi:hypothetical protein
VGTGGRESHRRHRIHRSQCFGGCLKRPLESRKNPRRPAKPAVFGNENSRKRVLVRRTVLERHGTREGLTKENRSR